MFHPAGAEPVSFLGVTFSSDGRGLSIPGRDHPLVDWRTGALLGRLANVQPDSPTQTFISPDRKLIPPAEVINQGRDGEYIHGLLTERYEREIARLPRVDFVLIRYGLNDRVRRQEFAVKFPGDYRELIGRLRRDHRGCQVILETVIPYFGDPKDREINDQVRAVASVEKLPLLDTHARYAAELKHGPNLLSYRRLPLEKVPAKYRSLLPAGSVTGNEVVVLDNLLDAHLRGVPGWFADRHPNLAGYHVIGDEMARFLVPRLRGRAAGAAR